jgi:hypothetical protein
MTCRDAVIAAMRSLRDRHDRRDFRVDEIVAEVLSHTSAFKVTTINTHIVSRMCAGAPANHAVVYGDLERVAPGRYRLRGS